MVVLLTKATKFMLKWQQKVLKISSAPLQKKSIRFCQVCSHPNNTLLMKYILQKWKGVKLGTWTIKNYWPCKQRKDVGNTYLQYLIRIIQSIYIYIYIYILTIFYVLNILLHVSMNLHHLQGSLILLLSWSYKNH